MLTNEYPGSIAGTFQQQLMKNTAIKNARLVD
ncbi:hypothetical protein predicted by Glimmer/Critica [Lactiplantibacillus plantarum]|nr:hypothetical protein predicted by Glimmer/Critica [Lactiplantibacillus plantarum]